MKIHGPPPARRRRNLTVAAGLLVHLLLATRNYGQPLEELRYGPEHQASPSAAPRSALEFSPPTI